MNSVTRYATSPSSTTSSTCAVQNRATRRAAPASRRKRSRNCSSRAYSARMTLIATGAPPWAVPCIGEEHRAHAALAQPAERRGRGRAGVGRRAAAARPEKARRARRPPSLSTCRSARVHPPRHASSMSSRSVVRPHCKPGDRRSGVSRWRIAGPCCPCRRQTKRYAPVAGAGTAKQAGRSGFTVECGAMCTCARVQLSAVAALVPSGRTRFRSRSKTYVIPAGPLFVAVNEIRTNSWPAGACSEIRRVVGADLTAGERDEDVFAGLRVHPALDGDRPGLQRDQPVRPGQRHDGLPGPRLADGQHRRRQVEPVVHLDRDHSLPAALSRHLGQIGVRVRHARRSCRRRWSAAGLRAARRRCPG